MNNITTTNDQSTMRGLGINPGQVAEYSRVSVEPVRFERESDLGWGVEYRAQHSADLKVWAGEPNSQIEVAGDAFTIKNGKPASYSALLAAWRERADA